MGNEGHLAPQIEKQKRESKVSVQVKLLAQHFLQFQLLNATLKLKRLRVSIS